MISPDAVESAYSFFHQKWRVYEYSHNGRQRDDIEYAISRYVENMDRELWRRLSHGRNTYLQDHVSFAKDMPDALRKLEDLLPV